MVSESVRAYSTIVPSFAQVVRGTLGEASDSGTQQTEVRLRTRARECPAWASWSAICFLAPSFSSADADRRSALQEDPSRRSAPGELA